MICSNFDFLKEGMKMYKVSANIYLNVSGKKDAYSLCVASTTAIFF